MEKGQSEYLNEKYFPSPSNMSFSPDCPCQTKLKISRNTEKLKSLELRINREVEKINTIFEGCSPSAVPTAPSSPSTQPPSSSPRAHPTSLSNSTPEIFPSSQSNLSENNVMLETISADFTFENSLNLEKAVDDNHASSDSTQQYDSDFEFSDNFEPPETSPKVPLN